MKIFGYIVGVLLLIYLVLCFMGDDKIAASRSTTIDAPAATIFQNIGDLKNWEAWMPWYKNDPTMKLEWGETTTGVGGHYSWKSENSGNGAMKIVEFNANRSMKTEIAFEGMGKSNGTWLLEPIADGRTKVTWGMEAQDDVAFPMRGMMKLMGMQEQLNSDFDKGLASLKEIAESAN